MALRNHSLIWRKPDKKYFWAQCERKSGPKAITLTFFLEKAHDARDGSILGGEVTPRHHSPTFFPTSKQSSSQGERDARRKHVNEHLSYPKTCKLGRKGNRNGIYYASAQRAPQLLTDHLPWKESVCKWIWIEPTNCPILCKQMAIIRRRKFVEERASEGGTFKESTTLSVEGRRWPFRRKIHFWVFFMPWTELQLTRLAKDNDIEVEPRRKRRAMAKSSDFVISPVGDQILARHQIQYNATEEVPPNTRRTPNTGTEEPKSTASSWVDLDAILFVKNVQCPWFWMSKYLGQA